MQNTKKSALIVGVLIIVLLAGSLYYFIQNKTANSNSSSSAITTSTIGSTTIPVITVQKNLLDGGGPNSSYTSRSEFEGIFGTNGIYTAFSCNQTYKTNTTLAVLCPPLFSQFNKTYGKNLTLWSVSYTTANSRVFESVILNKTGSKSGFGANLPSNNIFVNNTYNQISYSKLNNATYVIIVNSSPTNKYTFSIILVSKNKETAQIISVTNSIFNPAQNVALAATVSNDLA